MYEVNVGKLAERFDREKETRAKVRWEQYKTL
jgi:hypothetical protein